MSAWDGPIGRAGARQEKLRGLRSDIDRGAPARRCSSHLDAPSGAGGLVLKVFLIATPQGARFVVLRVLLIPSARGACGTAGGRRLKRFLSGVFDGTVVVEGVS